jgi:ABC-2 type transport system ATP-binding protein
LLVLDEPTNGLDPAGIVEIRELLKSRAREGRTVIVSSHLLGEIEAMVDRLVVIRSGELVYDGTLADLMLHASERVVAAPEQPSDLGRLVSLVEAGGCRYETAGDEVIVDMPAERSPELFRAADAAGLTLRMLNPESDTLEAVFLRLTGATDAELAEQRRKQRQVNES